MRRTTGTRRALAVVGAVLGVVVAASACSGGGSGGGSDSGGDAANEAAEPAAEPAAGVAAGVADRDAATGGAADDGLLLPERASVRDGVERPGGAANRPAVSTRAVIRRGEISIVTKEINRARLEIDDLLGRHGGYLAAEDTSNDRSGRPERSVLVLRVPEPAFDAVMDDLDGIGRTRQADRSSEDVTSELVDVGSRVATQEASLARLQRFLRQAENVEDMIRLESEIAERQADLESLQAQQKYLRDHTAMSTVTVRLRTPEAPPPTPQPQEAGFLAGLDGGWTALKAVLVGLATVVGAVLPFALVLGVVVVPGWLLVRTVRRRHTATPVEPADAG